MKSSFFLLQVALCLTALPLGSAGCAHIESHDKKVISRDILDSISEPPKPFGIPKHTITLQSDSPTNDQFQFVVVTTRACSVAHHEKVRVESVEVHEVKDVQNPLISVGIGVGLMAIAIACSATESMTDDKDQQKQRHNSAVAFGVLGSPFLVPGVILPVQGVIAIDRKSVEVVEEDWVAQKECAPQPESGTLEIEWSPGIMTNGSIDPHGRVTVPMPDLDLLLPKPADSESIRLDKVGIAVILANGSREDVEAKEITSTAPFVALAKKAEEHRKHTIETTFQQWTNSHSKMAEKLLKNGKTLLARRQELAQSFDALSDRARYNIKEDGLRKKTLGRYKALGSSLSSMARELERLPDFPLSRVYSMPDELNSAESARKLLEEVRLEKTILTAMIEIGPAMTKPYKQCSTEESSRAIEELRSAWSLFTEDSTQDDDPIWIEKKQIILFAAINACAQCNTRETLERLAIAVEVHVNSLKKWSFEKPSGLEGALLRAKLRTINTLVVNTIERLPLSFFLDVLFDPECSNPIRFVVGNIITHKDYPGADPKDIRRYLKARGFSENWMNP